MNIRSKHKNKNTVFFRCSLACAISMISTTHAVTFAQDESKAEENIEEVRVLGSRRAGRNVIETSVPVDVIGSEAIERSGHTQTVELLQSLIPSFNSFKNSITDATDYVRPAQLRGLGPEHVLVLVNGKRRHTSAVVHDNEQAKGSVNVDLNSIPPGAIDSIEVLRDGAAAQYGSDAIAGVINIKLKRSTELRLSATYGLNISSEARGYSAGELLNGTNTDAMLSAGTIVDWTNYSEKKQHRDGETSILSLSKGWEFENDAFIHASVQQWKQSPSNRAGIDPTLQYFATRPDGTQTTDVTEIKAANSDADPANDIALDIREVGFDRDENWWFGKSELKDVSLFLNGEVPVSSKTKVYGSAGKSRRDGRGPCFWRQPNSNNTVRSIFPDGYLPNVKPEIDDSSVILGFKGDVGRFEYDVSHTFGKNDFNFKGRTLNVSFGNNSPTEFDGGGTKFTQNTSNVDFTTEYDIGASSPLNVAFGVEYRKEKYEIYAGQTEAFADGGFDVLDGPNAGANAVIGTQCAQAFGDFDEVSESRDNSAAYLDIETDITDAFTLGVAARFENYSDFGSTADGKISARYAFTDELALRGAASTGFRAPALQQQFYSNRSLQTTSGGALRQTGTFPVNHPAAVALGASALEPEESTNLSLGFTVNIEDFTFTFDYYQVDIDDRIVLSDRFTGDTPAQTAGLAAAVEAASGLEGVEQVVYFINGIDTSTKGFDIIAKYALSDRFDLMLSLNKSDTDVKSVAPTPSALTPFTNDPIAGDTLINNLEQSQPEMLAHFTVDYHTDIFSAVWRSTYYGEITAAERFSGNNPINFQVYDGQFIHNAEASFTFDNGITFSVGGNNLFDTYPDKRFKSQSFSGRLPYSGYVPYGFTGRYIYSRVEWKWD